MTSQTLGGRSKWWAPDFHMILNVQLPVDTDEALFAPMLRTALQLDLDEDEDGWRSKVTNRFL